MSGHLSAGQIAEWMSGARNPASESHLSECVACRLQVEDFQTALTKFRGAVRSWSETQYADGKHPAWRHESTRRRVQSLGQPRLHWAAAAAALCALIALFLFHGGAPRPILSGEAHSEGIADAALMGQVDIDVSQTVPEAMEPLMRLVSWDGAPRAEVSGNRQSAKEEE